MKTVLFGICVLPVLLAATACDQREAVTAPEPAAASTDEMEMSGGEAAESELREDALSATYPSHAENATVVAWNGDVLKEGDNGFVCMPTPPMFAERGAAAPMCLDDVWMKWADAWQNKQPFSTDRLGIAYMLAGDGGASNVDPYATQNTGDNEWIVEGAHLMLLVPDSAMLADIPTDPDSGGPYVMWRGTEYEHVMVPVKAPEAGRDATSPLADALSAADTSMQDGAAAMAWDGEMLKEGDGGYTCMPTPPQFTSGRAPMCFDSTWMAWGKAWQNKEPFAADKLGIAYMLAGDEGASNTDPYATEATDGNDWVEEGPHMMIVVPDSEMLAGITRDPSSGGPYVMWDGTDYAHVMVPIADRP